MNCFDFLCEFVRKSGKLSNNINRNFSFQMNLLLKFHTAIIAKYKNLQKNTYKMKLLKSKENREIRPIKD